MQPSLTDRPPAPRPRLVLIAAVARNAAIGKRGDLVWREPADQRHFRDTTTGHAVLMGRKTWDSLPPRFRPLPGRHNLVLSRQAGLRLPGADVATSLQAALATVATACAQQTPTSACAAYVIGGAELYAQALPLADELLLTEIDADLDGDTFFPAWDRSCFDADAGPTAVAADGRRYRFVSYTRRR